jgi:iron-sulfur cluster assembly protein
MKTPENEGRRGVGMITMSDVAADKIKEILNAEGVPNHSLRVVANEGGCCGPTYEIMIDETSGEGDTVVEKNGARLFVDASTAKVLDGAVLGFASDEEGEGFTLGFPNGAPAGDGCGCGQESPKRGGACGPSSGGCGCS